MKLLVEHINYFGYLGTFLSNIIMFPIIYKMIKTKKVRDLNIWSNFIGLAANTVWLVYGVVLHLYPVLLLNGMWMLINFFMMYLIIAYKDNS